MRISRLLHHLDQTISYFGLKDKNFDIVDDLLNFVKVADSNKEIGSQFELIAHAKHPSSGACQV